MAIRTERKRVTKEPDVRRQELMDAAVHVFKEKGIGRTTVADITAAAGVAKGTFYLYFDSKEHLLGALKEQFIGEILENAAAVYSRVGQEDWESVLDAGVTSITDFFIAREDMIYVMVQEGVTEETKDLYAECERKVDEVFLTAIRLGVDSGAFGCTDPEMTARLLHAAFEGVLEKAILYGEGIDRDRFINAAKEMVRKTLAPPGVYASNPFTL